MANNVFFYYTILLVGYISYLFFGNKLIFMGLGILFWGLINCLDHLIYTIIDRKISPGLFTGLLYLITFLSGINRLHAEGTLNFKLIILSLITGIFYAVIPVILSMKCSGIFKRIFI
ncbi:HXXEE domain-containing protein [Lacrimispora sp. 38-1]|uniref:HXXEE domain-containing protein n=1 Tax=Lacrimispora sp. 38-1 TaxID=3125778 RepID=UPI003CE75EEB